MPYGLQGNVSQHESNFWTWVPPISTSMSSQLGCAPYMRAIQRCSLLTAPWRSSSLKFLYLAYATPSAWNDIPLPFHLANSYPFFHRSPGSLHRTGWGVDLLLSPHLVWAPTSSKAETPCSSLYSPLPTTSLYLTCKEGIDGQRSINKQNILNN